MTQQIIGVGSSADDGTGDTLRAAGNKINANFAELYGRVGDSSTAVSFADLGVVFEGPLTDSFETTLLPTNPTLDRSVYLPDANGTIITDSATQTLVNKTILSPVISTPQINDTSSNHRYIITPSELVADRTVNLPILSSTDTIAFENHGQTLTNKTLTSPLINSPNIGTSLNDVNGAEVIKTPATAGAVNEITITNSATTVAPTITATGNDTNINLKLAGAGNGTVEMVQVSYTSAEMTGDGVVPAYAYIVFNSSGSIAAELIDGTVVGETKIFSNKNSGTATVTPTNYSQGSTFALTQADGCTAIWDGVNWNLIGQYGVVVT